MKSIFSSGSKQTDLEIFKYVDDKDIVNVCLINKATNKLLSEDKYWLQRFFYFYKKYLKDVNFRSYKVNKTWKEYYIDITRKLKNPFPYYQSAMALAERRMDVLYILQNYHGAKVKGIITYDEEDNIEYYCTRNGKMSGIKEGPYCSLNLPANSNKSDLNYQIISKFPTRQEKIYRDGIKQSSAEFINNIKIIENIYEDEELKRVTKWNKKGVKIYEEIHDGMICDVTEWFVSGDIKCEKHFDEGKKDGIWYRWNKKGEKSTKYFRDGKKVEYIPTAQERADDAAYLAELLEQVERERKMGLC